MSDPIDETPSQTRIKICGLRDVETALVAAEAGADFIGLNFVGASPRYIAPAVAREIAAALPPRVTAVGLFCNHPLEHIVEFAEVVGFQTAQLHGEETPEFAKQLRGLNILKALPFDPATLANQLDGWRTLGDQLTSLLIDTPPQPNAAITGGSGHAFDWSRLAAFDRSGGFDGLPPYLLAGGLTPDNVGEAIRTTRPWGVDVSSGVESSRGVKYPGLIKAFCEAVREADASLAMD